jgi:hypothetical protein
MHLPPLLVQLTLTAAENRTTISRNGEYLALAAVHPSLKDHLDRGCAATLKYDMPGKIVAGYIRCKCRHPKQTFVPRANWVRKSIVSMAQARGDS